MVPKITSAGRSFKGAARYYLHDKGAETAERVAFVETRNLDTSDPSRAVARMIDTATSAGQLKQAAGVKGGRPLKHPVYTFSLAWHPNETPTRDEQMEAAREALTALGMDDREALIVAHKDTAHPHVHVMVNRVCPRTGRAASNSEDRLKLQNWAEDHDRRHGRDHCPQRRKNREAREAGQWRKGEGRAHYGWHNSKSAETKTMQPQRKAQFDALWRQKDQRADTRQLEIKTLYKPIWRDVFKRQKKELKDFDAGLHKRIGFAVKRRRGLFSGTVKALLDGANLRAEFIRHQESERKTIADQQGRTMRDAGREVTKAWKYDRDTLKNAHKAEDQARYEATQAKTREVWSTQPQTIEQGNTPRPEFEQEADRRKTENQTDRDRLEAAPEQEKERARQEAREKSREIMRGKRERAKGRTRSRTRKPR